MAGSLTEDEKVALLGFEVSYGKAKDFTIELSTLPGRVGASVLHEPMALSDVRSTLEDPSKALVLGALPPAGGWKKTT